MNHPTGNRSSSTKQSSIPASQKDELILPSEKRISALSPKATSRGLNSISHRPPVSKPKQPQSKNKAIKTEMFGNKRISVVKSEGD